MALAVVCLFSPPLAPAEPERELGRPDTRPTDRLHIPSSVHLDLIRPAELLPGGSLAVVFDGNDLGSAPINSQVSRTLPALWQIDLEPGAPSAYHAQYELIAADGRPGGLSLAAGDAFVPVVLETIEPSMSRAIDGSVRVEGGLKLHLSLAGVTRSGNYTGTLVVTLHRF